MEESQQYCPTCNAKVHFSSRYPNYICKDCEQKITDKNGTLVIFYNAYNMGMGCQGYYKNNQQKFEGNSCYVNGIECYAEEAYLGGIVIRLR